MVSLACTLLLSVFHSSIPLSLAFTYSHLQQIQNTSNPRDADLHAKDGSKYTPVVLAAEAGSKKADCQAFQFFMTYIGDDIGDVTKNPLFQALELGDNALPAVKVIVTLLHVFSVTKSYGLGSAHFQELKLKSIYSALYYILCTHVCSLQLMIGDSVWSKKLCQVTNNLKNNLLHEAIMKDLARYVYKI